MSSRADRRICLNCRAPDRALGMPPLPTPRPACRGGCPALPAWAGVRVGVLRRHQLQNPDPLQPLNRSDLNFNSFALGRPSCRAMRSVCLEWESRTTGISRSCPQEWPGDALRDGIDGGALFSRTPVSGLPVSGSRPASRQLLWVRLCKLCQNPVNRIRACRPLARSCPPHLQLCNTRPVHWGRRAFGPNFVWHPAALCGYVHFRCLGRCAGSCGGSLLGWHDFACENSRVGRRG